MYLSLIIAFILILFMVVGGIQNTASFDIKFFTWNLQLTLAALIFYSSLIGACIIAVLLLPKFVSKSIKVRRLNKEIYELKTHTAALEKHQEEES